MFQLQVQGKTETLAYMIQRSLRYNFPVVFIVRGRNLIHNAADRFKKNGIDFSVFMAGDYRRDVNKLLQICSADTLNSRSQYPFKDRPCLVILDEAHLDYKKIYEEYKDAFIIGATATPFSDVSVYDTYVQTIEPYELRDQGFLVKDKFYVPHIIDTSSVKMRMGDFDKKQLESVVTQSAVVGNIVEDWKELGQNRPTLVFATSIEHSLQLKQSFCSAGVTAIHCDASSSDTERKKAREDIISGKIKVICNVDIFSTGWDCKEISCIVFARPTFSLNWFLQSTGRGLRPSPGKEDCIFIDSAGNIFRSGSPYKVREISLEAPTKRKSKAYETRVTTCLECYYVFDPSTHESCPECGWEIPKTGRRVNEVDGKLIEYAESPDDLAIKRKKMIVQKYRDLEWGRRKNNLHPDWSFIQLFRSFSREEMKHLLTITRVPDRFLP